jgi:hypothetical protein
MRDGTTRNEDAPSIEDDEIEIEIFDEDGALSRAFLLRRGFCCENGCKNCPYGFRKPSRVEKEEA